MEVEPGAASATPVRGHAWLWLAVVVSAVYSLVVLVLPARGLTFLWDDWTLLSRFNTTPWPSSWLAPHNGHWFPLFSGVFDLEWRAFGANHTAYLLVTWAVHVLNVGLMAKLLERVVGDARAGALGAAAFGVSTAYRDILWWAECGGMAIALTICLAGFLALDRASTGRPRAIVGAAVAAFAAPLFFDGALALGPALALGSLLLLPRGMRLRGALATSGGWLVFAIASVSFTTSPANRGLPDSLSAAAEASEFVARAIGVGVLQQNLLVHTSEGPAGAWLAFGAYAAAVGAAVWIAGPRTRVFLLVLQAFFVCVALPMALVRWNWPIGAAVFSRHQYLPGVAWAALLATLAERGMRRTRVALVMAVLGVGALGVGHAYVAARDSRASAPGMRRQGPEFVARLVSATTAARGPVFDARLPQGFAGFMVLRVHEVVDTMAGRGRVVWTEERTSESLAAYGSDGWLEPLAR